MKGGDIAVHLRVVHDVERVELQVGVALRGSGHALTRHVDTANKTARFGHVRALVRYEAKRAAVKLQWEAGV